MFLRLSIKHYDSLLPSLQGPLDMIKLGEQTRSRRNRNQPHFSTNIPEHLWFRARIEPGMKKGWGRCWW